MKGSDRCHADDAFCSVRGQTLRVSNLSPGGLFAVCRHPPPAGDTVVLHVPLPRRPAPAAHTRLFCAVPLPRRPAHVEGVVCWITPEDEPLTHSVPPGFGVR